MIAVLVTGKDSQLARCMKDLEIYYPQIEFHFKNSKELDITDKNAVNKTFENKYFNYCVNCAAYTAVEMAETEAQKAKRVNTIGAKYLAEASHKFKMTLIHISTDFVFDGEKNEPYTESDETNPQSVYGITKRDGENEIIKAIKEHFIIRTSWLYSEYGNNFVKTVKRLTKDNKEVRIVNDQIGSPTNANDLAMFILRIIKSNSKDYGIYNFSNSGSTSWYDFAKEIIRYVGTKTIITPISTTEYPTLAKRPKSSILNNSKAKKIFDVKSIHWSSALGRFFNTDIK